jgi:hypothetical protein
LEALISPLKDRLKRTSSIVASVLILSGRWICTAITVAGTLFSISICIFVLAESAISSGANGVISRHGCGDQSFAEVIYLQAIFQMLMVKLVPKKPDFFDQKYSQPALHVDPNYLLPRLMRL